MKRWYVLAGGAIAMFAAMVSVPPHAAVVSSDANDASPRAQYESAAKLLGEPLDDQRIFRVPTTVELNLGKDSAREISPERLRVIKELQNAAGDDARRNWFALNRRVGEERNEVAVALEQVVAEGGLDVVREFPTTAPAKWSIVHAIDNVKGFHVPWQINDSLGQMLAPRLSPAFTSADRALSTELLNLGNDTKRWGKFEAPPMTPQERVRWNSAAGGIVINR